MPPAPQPPPEPPAEEEEEEPPEPEPVPPLSDEDFEARKEIFDEIFVGQGAIELKEKARAERKAQDREDIPSLKYSEMECSMVHQVLNKVKVDHGPLFESKGIFLDLGSGAGKVCVSAALLHPFEKVVGIETLQCLNTVANEAHEKYKEAQLPEGVLKPEIELIPGDFAAEFETKLEAIAEQVVVALAVATCYGEAELNAMAAVARKMPDESIFISFTQGLPESIVIDMNRNPARRRERAVRKALSRRGVEPSTIPIEVEPPVNDPFGWTLVHTEEMQMMWGPATCFIYKKIVIPELRPPPEEEGKPQEEA